MPTQKEQILDLLNHMISVEGQLAQANLSTYGDTHFLFQRNDACIQLLRGLISTIKRSIPD